MGSLFFFSIKMKPNSFHIPIKNFKYGEKDEVLTCTSPVIRILPVSNLRLCMAHM